VFEPGSNAHLKKLLTPPRVQQCERFLAYREESGSLAHMAILSMAVWNWLVDNRTWVFDGFGVAVAAGLIGMLWNRRKREPDEAGMFAVREWVDLAKEKDQRARGLEEQLARARVSGERLIASTDAMGDGITRVVASNKELAELAKDNLKLAEAVRAEKEELADRYDAAYLTLSNMHMALSDDTPEPDLARDRDRILLARWYAYQFHEALEFYLAAAKAGGRLPNLHPEAAERFRAIPEIGEPPQLLETSDLNAATKDRLRQRLVNLSKHKRSSD
jgi:hypothetical protein